MILKGYRKEMLKFILYLTMVLDAMLEIDHTEGIQWMSNASTISVREGETANFTWQYMKEDNEDIDHFQWRFNNTILIAYRAIGNGFKIHDDKYIGRVEGSGGNGLLLKNISSNDTGHYSLHISIAWKEKDFNQSISLCVKDTEEEKIQPWCTCEGLTMPPKWNSQQTINMETDGCSLELNSSFCCIKKPASRCKENYPRKICEPIQESINRIENITPSKITNYPTEHYIYSGPVLGHESPQNNSTAAWISWTTMALTFLLVLFAIGLIIYVSRRHWKKTKYYSTPTMESKKRESIYSKLESVYEEPELVVGDKPQPIPLVLQERIDSKPSNDISTVYEQPALVVAHKPQQIPLMLQEALDSKPSNDKHSLTLEPEISFVYEQPALVVGDKPEQIPLVLHETLDSKHSKYRHNMTLEPEIATVYEQPALVVGDKPEQISLVLQEALDGMHCQYEGP